MIDIMLSSMPRDWSVQRLGQLFRERREKVSDKDYAPLSVTKNGIVPQLSTAAKTDDGDNRKGVRAGDYVINSRSDRKGSSGLSELDGSVSLINIVLEPQRIAKRFAHHLLRSTAFQEEFYRWGHGIVADLWTTRYFDMKNIRIGVPDLQAQKMIAKLLDYETASIDNLIDHKRRFMNLLNERNETAITNLMTRGQNQQVSLKAAATPFFSQIPSHWIEERLRFSVRKMEQGWSPPSEQRQVSGEEWGILKVGCMNFGHFRPDEHKVLPADVAPRPDLQVRMGDLLMSRGNSLELVGSAAIVTEWRPRLMLSDLIYRISLDKRRACPEFVALALNSRPLRRQIELCASGASDTMPKISQEKIKNLVWLRPPVEEQEAISDQLLKATVRNEALISFCQMTIDRLSEFRSALITASVTGRIDLEEWRKEGATSRRLEALEAEARA